MKKLISLAIAASIIGNGSIYIASAATIHGVELDEATVSAILGTRKPPSIVRVGTTKTPSFHSVHWFDNIINLTNRVLDRSIRADIVRVHPESLDGDTSTAIRGQESMEEHCITRLTADLIRNPAGECGAGLISR